MGNSVQVQVLLPAPNEFLTSDPLKGNGGFLLLQIQRDKEIKRVLGHQRNGFDNKGQIKAIIDTN